MTHRDAGRRLLKAVRRHVAPSGPARPVDYALAGKADENRVTRTSVRRAVEDEQARTVSDILRRRLSVGWEPDLGVGSAVEAARLAGELLGWSEEDQMRQVEAYRTEIERSFRPRNPSAVSLPVAEAAQ